MATGKNTHWKAIQFLLAGYHSLKDNIDNYNPLGVYIYYPGISTAYFTGIISATVSRFHVKIEEVNKRVFLIDHGVDGKGSRNGTYLNGERIKPGQKVLLKPGDSFSWVG